MIKKIELVWAVLCEKSLIDSESNNLSLTNILEEILITPPSGTKFEEALSSAPKIVPINFELVSMWRKLAEGEIKTPIKIEALDPNEKIMTFIDSQLELSKSLGRLRFRARFAGLPITIPGNYCFKIKIQQGKTWKEVGRTYLEVKIALPKSK